MINKMDLVATLMFFSLYGCSTKASVVPALEGQPRIPINNTVPSINEYQPQ